MHEHASDHHGHIYGADPGSPVRGVRSVAEYLLSELKLECLSALDWHLAPFHRTDSR